MTVSTTSASVTEGSTASYTVVLDSQPTADVTIAVAKQSGGDASLTLNPASLTFTSSNWNQTQTVTVSAAQDDDGRDGTATITHTATSADADYSGITIASVTATEDDNDPIGVTRTATNWGNIDEGGSKTYTLKLNTQPTHDVTIAVANRARPPTTPI